MEHAWDSVQGVTTLAGQGSFDFAMASVREAIATFRMTVFFKLFKFGDIYVSNTSSLSC